VTALPCRPLAGAGKETIGDRGDICFTKGGIKHLDVVAGKQCNLREQPVVVGVSDP
jgi:hypothetical protein